MRVRARAAFLLVLTGFAGDGLLYAQSPSPEEMVRRAEQSAFPDAFLMHATLETRKSGAVTSSMDMVVSYKRLVGSRIEILAPARSRGIRFLQKEGALWMFNPQAGTGQAIRLSPRAAFEGSVFSNRDIGDPQYSTQYDMRLQGTETFNHPELGRVTAFVLEGTARSETTAYSRVTIWVRQGDFMLLQGEYYAKSGLLFKKETFTGMREMAGKERPTVMRVVSFDQPDRESILTITSLAEKPDLPDSLFSLAALTR